MKIAWQNDGTISKKWPHLPLFGFCLYLLEEDIRTDLFKEGVK